MNLKTASARYLLTASVVLVAVLAVLWKYWAYVTNPWTRDGQVRANVIQVAPRVSGLIVKLVLLILFLFSLVSWAIIVTKFIQYRRARAAGVPGERIVFSGVGKTAAEIRLALEGGVDLVPVFGANVEALYGSPGSGTAISKRAGWRSPTARKRSNSRPLVQ